MTSARFRPVRALLCLVMAMIAGVATAPAASAAPPTPQFGREIDSYAAYTPQSTCDPTAKPGVVDFQNLLSATYGRPSLGIIRACDPNAVSEHQEGRALDYPFNANDATQRAQAQDVINWLLATDRYGNAHALLRRLGIMYIIWDRRIWSTSSKTWSAYSGASPHTDHIHFSFGWPGARRQTTWWRPAGTQEGDVTGDGFADLTTVDAEGRLAVFGNGILLPSYEGRPFRDRLWRTNNANWGTDAKSITTADVTGDGYADFLVLTANGVLQIYGNGILINADHAPFTGVYRQYTDGWKKATHIAAGDVNRDGWADLAATIDGKLHIFLNTKETGPDAWPFRDAAWVYDSWGPEVLDIALGDVTGDSYADLVTVRTDGRLTVFGNGLLLPQFDHKPFLGPTWSTATAADQIDDISVARVTDDGYADLMVITKGGDLQVYPNVITDPRHNEYFTTAQWVYTDWDGVHHIA